MVAEDVALRLRAREQDVGELPRPQLLEHDLDLLDLLLIVLAIARDVDHRDAGPVALVGHACDLLHHLLEPPGLVGGAQHGDACPVAAPLLVDEHQQVARGDHDLLVVLVLEHDLRDRLQLLVGVRVPLLDRLRQPRRKAPPGDELPGRQYLGLGRSQRLDGIEPRRRRRREGCRVGRLGGPGRRVSLLALLQHGGNVQLVLLHLEHDLEHHVADGQVVERGAQELREGLLAPLEQGGPHELRRLQLELVGIVRRLDRPAGIEDGRVQVPKRLADGRVRSAHLLPDAERLLALQVGVVLGALQVALEVDRPRGALGRHPSRRSRGLGAVGRRRRSDRERAELHRAS